jgi:hypothetical protein
LYFRAIYRFDPWTPARLDTLVEDDGGMTGAERYPAWRSIQPANAMDFLTVMRGHRGASVAEGVDTVTNDVTEKGHTFTLSRSGRQRALKVFTIGWTPGVVDIADELLTRLRGKRAGCMKLASYVAS